MCGATLLLLAALPALAGRAPWGADGEVVSVVEPGGGQAGGAGGPAFAPGQHTSVLAPLGQAATLECRVLRLRDKSVSWVRSRDLQILSHAGAVFTADARVSAAAGGDVTDAADAADAGASASRHTLRIERLRPADAGRYECQVNTEPKMSLFFNLTVVDEPVPEVVVAVVGPARVAARAGGAVTLACEARYEPAPRLLPLPPLDIRWRRGDEPVDWQSGRGVALDTQRWAGRALSRLRLGGLAARDAGGYTCSAAGRAAALRLLLDSDESEAEQAEAMQRDQAASAAPPPRAPPPAPSRARAALLALLALALR